MELVITLDPTATADIEAAVACINELLGDGPGEPMTVPQYAHWLVTDQLRRRRQARQVEPAPAAPRPTDPQARAMREVQAMLALLHDDQRRELAWLHASLLRVQGRFYGGEDILRYYRVLAGVQEREVGR